MLYTELALQIMPEGLPSGCKLLRSTKSLFASLKKAPYLLQNTISYQIHRAVDMCFEAIINRAIKLLNDRLLEREKQAVEEMKEKCEKDAKEMLIQLEDKYNNYVAELENKVGQGKQTVEELLQEIGKLKKAKEEAEEQLNTISQELLKIAKSTELVEKGKVAGKSGFFSGFM